MSYFPVLIVEKTLISHLQLSMAQYPPRPPMPPPECSKDSDCNSPNECCLYRWPMGNTCARYQQQGNDCFHEGLRGIIMDHSECGCAAG